MKPSVAVSIFFVFLDHQLVPYTSSSNQLLYVY